LFDYEANPVIAGRGMKDRHRFVVITPRFDIAARVRAGTARYVETLDKARWMRSSRASSALSTRVDDDASSLWKSGFWFHKKPY
jgi:hypothetical protein